jgi:hypothetical protein
MEEDNVLVIKTHYFAALFIYFLKSIAMVGIAYVSLLAASSFVGFDILSFIGDTLKLAFSNLFSENR